MSTRCPFLPVSCAVLVAALAGAASAGTSIEFGRKAWGTDYTQQSTVGGHGTLFSVWTKIPDPGPTYPWSRGNMNVYYLIGANWYLICLVGNSSALSPTNARYNANSMFFANSGPIPNDGGTWIGDYSYYESGLGNPEAPYRDWVWAAWQFVLNGDSFTVRQWLKFGLDGDVFAAGENQATFADLRTILVQKGWTQAQAGAWTPSDAVSFQVGAANGYLTHARIYARSTAPSLTELDIMARSSLPDANAWGDYALEWSNGAPDLQDGSGNGHALALAAGGTLYQGPVGPPLTATPPAVVPVPGFATVVLAVVLGGLLAFASRRGSD